MYARVTQYQMDPNREDEVLAKLDTFTSQIQALPGVVAAYVSWRSEDGQGVTTAIYESQADAEAATAMAQNVWAELGPFMVVAPTAAGYENVRDMLA